MSMHKTKKGRGSKTDELTGRGPRSFGSSEALLLCCTGIFSLGSSCSEENKQDVFQSKRDAYTRDTTDL